ncbi:MAG: hypothetical protein QGF67_16615, partial [Lentisphaeria bacterium]|nr:hypothetical protein [Lentisphaeria bacterium]
RPGHLTGQSGAITKLSRPVFVGSAFFCPRTMYDFHIVKVHGDTVSQGRWKWPLLQGIESNPSR